MERLELEASMRSVLGKKVKALRREGVIPANIYGHGVESTAIQVEAKALLRTLAQAGETGLISIKVAGTPLPRPALVRGFQRAPRTGDLLHVDFYQVSMTERIHADVPLTLVGEAPVIKNKGGVLVHTLDSVSVEALPDALPRSIEVNVSGLTDFQHALRVGDLPVPKGVTVLTDPEELVVKVEAPRVEVPAAVTGEAPTLAKAEAAEKTPEQQT